LIQFTKMKEKELQKLIIEWLRWKKYFFFRNNTGAFAPRAGGFYRFGAVGSPDIICVVDGRFVGIECKMVGKSQSVYQKNFQENLEAAGGIYILAYNLEDVMNKFIEL